MILAMISENHALSFFVNFSLYLTRQIHYTDQNGKKQGRKRPLDTPKRMWEIRQREGEREKER